MLLKSKVEKLPQLKTVAAPKKSSTSGTGVNRSRTVADDSAAVAVKMKELFSDYDWKLVTTEEELLEYVSTSDEFGLDTETTGLDTFKDDIVGFSIGTEDNCIYVPLKHKVGKNYSGDLKKLEEILATKKLWGFNAKFDMKMLKLHAGITVKVVWCGYLAARLKYSAEPDNGLKALYCKYIDPDAQFYSFGTLFKMPFDKYDPEVVGGYAAVDAMKHIRLGKWQEKNLDRAERKLLEKLELPLAHELVGMELTGVQLDVEWCNKLSALLEKDIEEIAKKINEMSPGLNPSSPKQVAEVLYQKLNLPHQAGAGTSEGELKALKHPLCDLILEYRGAQKLLSTYAAKMPKIADDGIVHCQFNQYGADTGRFSSSNPNLQNIPKDNRFRAMFIARPGHTLVSCDYTQQEVYILAALADDESMRSAYEKGMDFYAYMASIVFDMPYEQCGKHGAHGELRNQMKSIVLGLNYDMGLASLAHDIGKSVEETRAIYDKFFEKCPKIKEFRQKQVDFALKHGYVETVLGRKRYFKDLHKPDFECSNPDVLETLSKLHKESTIAQLIADAKKEGIEVIDRRKRKVVETRQVVNSVIQGSAADMTKLAMLTAFRDEKLKAMGCKIVLQIHDEIIAEFPDEYAEEGGNYLASLMVDVGSDLIGLRMVCEPSLMKVWQKD